MTRLAHRRLASTTDERGVTLIELAFVLAIMAVLLAVVLPIVSTLWYTNSRVNVTYQNVDEQLWLSTNLQRLVRAAVAPTPSRPMTSGVAPVPAFVAGTLSPTSMTFYTNIGTPRGPAKVIASCTQTTTHTTRCMAPTSTFTVTLTKANAGKCPATTGTYVNHCTYTTPRTKRTLIRITHVKNGANKPPEPLFVYAFGPQPTPGTPMKVTTICAMRTVTVSGTKKNLPTGCTSNATVTDATTLSTASCKVTTLPLKIFNNCPAGEVEKVSYDLLINNKTTPRYGGAQAEDDTGIFVLSSTSMLYEPAVG